MLFGVIPGHYSDGRYLIFDFNPNLLTLILTLTPLILSEPY